MRWNELVDSLGGGDFNDLSSAVESRRHREYAEAAAKIELSSAYVEAASRVSRFDVVMAIKHIFNVPIMVAKIALDHAMSRQEG